MKLPKNIRQIGEVEEEKKVYLEDYVMTYVRQMAEKEGAECRAAVLLGQAQWHNNARYLFINGAVEVEGFRRGGSPTFSNQTWSDIYDKIKTYFEEVEVVGWVFTRKGQEFRIDEDLRKIHLENFPGQDKALLIYDGEEKEEGLFLYSGNHFKRLKGHYIYYEKNAGMQSFMVDGRRTKSSANEKVEQAVKDMREKMSSKKEERQTTKKYAQYAYGVGMVVAAIILIIGTTRLSGRSKKDGLGNALDVINEGLTSPQSDGQVQVETVEGDVDKKENEEAASTGIPPGKAEDVSIEGQTGEEVAAASPEAGQEQDVSTEASVAPPTGETAENATPPAVTDAPPSGETSEENPEGQEAVPNEEASAGGYDYYIVKKGDTLSQISESIFKSIYQVETIRNINNLSSEDYIYEGQRLMIPKQ